jgi:hypothetical protein
MKCTAFLLGWSLCAVVATATPPTVKAEVGDAPPQQLVQVEPGFEVSGALATRQAISRDGRVVAFTPIAPVRLIGFPEQLPAGQEQTLLIDRATGSIELVTRAPDGGFHMPGDRFSGWYSMSDDGRFLAFSSASTDLDPLASQGLYTTFVYDRASQTVRAIDVEPGQGRGYGFGAIDGSGRTAVIQCRGLAGVPMGSSEIGLCQLDLASGAVRFIRRFSWQHTLGFRLSRDGRWVVLGYDGPVLTSGASNPLNQLLLYVMSVDTGAVELISVAPDGTPAVTGTAIAFSISDDGDFVAFRTQGTNLLPGGNPPGSILVRQRATGIVRFVSAGGIRGAVNPLLSGDGRRLLYIVTGGASDILQIYDWETKSSRAATGAPGGQPDASLCDFNSSFYFDHLIAMSGDGRTIVFPSLASNLVPGDVPNTCDLFVRQLGPVPQPAAPVPGPSPTWLFVLAVLLILAGTLAAARRSG